MSAGEPGRHIQIQDQGQIGGKIIQHRAVDPPDGFTIKAPAHALIGVS